MSTTSTTPNPTNQHFSVDPTGKPVVDLTFVKEPLGLPAEEGENSFVAVKVLKGRIWEQEALKLVSSPPSSHCLQLLSHFTIPGKGSAGEHLCFVTPVLGGDVKSLFERHGQVFPFKLAKRILLQMLRGIAHAHRSGVVHTDLKLDNIFFNNHMSTVDVEGLLASDPPRRHPLEASVDGTVQAAVSQPLPIPTAEEATQCTYVVADFGSAQSITNQIADEITAYPLRPPEILIGGPWNEKVDIWTFGCLVFEFVTSRALFNYKPYPKYHLDEPNYHLYTMLCYTGEDFSAEQLTVSPLAAKYFDSTFMDEADILPTATLMRRCLRLNPADRASAHDLLLDPWFVGVD
ncbi:kinase-like protein [Gautieria morchelliformis]|nr:kinase-like protein [Gautieria morchelliformis]